MFIQILSLFVFVIFFVFEYLTKYRRITRYVNQMPGPPTWPILGHVPQMLTTSEQIFETLRVWDAKYYPTYGLWLAHKAIVNILHPDDIQILFTSTKHTEKSFFYYPLNAWLGTGLLTSHGVKWQQRRKMLSPAFHFNILHKYYASIFEHVEKTTNTLKSSDEAVCNITKLLSDFTLDLICETIMGVKLTDAEFPKQYRQAIHHMGACTVYRIVNPLYAPESVFRLTLRGQKYKKSLNTLHEFTKKIIKERKEYHEKTDDQFLNEFKEDESFDVSTDDAYYGSRKKRLAMLDLLIAEQKNGRIDDEGIQEEVATFAFEGHDTTSLTLSYAILLIAEHKDAQIRIRNEVSQVLDRNGGRLEMSDLRRFHYVEMCLKESMRLYPIVPFISRNVTEDLQLTNYLVPKGAMIKVPTYSVHRVPEFWPNPEKFDPDRFLPENIKGRHPYSYIPFSAGPRNCIGQKFAMLEMKTFLGMLIYRFHVEPVSESQKLSLLADLVLRPNKPIYVKLSPINKNL